MESLSEKYLKLLAEYKKLQNSVSSMDREDTMCNKRVEQCSHAYNTLYGRKQLLVKEITKLYKMWFPPRISSFFSTIVPWIKRGFKVSKSAEDRLDICKKCDLFTERGTCEACGCYMIGKAKIPQARCPIGKWDAEKPT